MSTTISTWTDRGARPGLRDEIPATNILSTTIVYLKLREILVTSSLMLCIRSRGGRGNSVDAGWNAYKVGMGG
jgi:hypothetical protein